METLDDILSGNPGEPTEPAIEQQPETIGQPRDEQGRFASPETGVEPEQGEPEPEAVPPTAGLPKEEYKALKAEREKRQQIEAKLAALEQQFASLQQPTEQAPPPSLWEDENAWGGQLVTTAVQQASLNARLDMSEMMVRQANPDFEEVKAEFLAIAQQNPAVVQEAMADPHPWNKAYQIAKNARVMRELGATDIETLRAKIREEELAKLQATKPAAPALPTSLAQDQSARVATAPDLYRKPTFNDILNGRA